MYIQFACYLDFQKLKKFLENIFSRCHKVNFTKKHILAIFGIIFQKVDIISDVIIPIAAISKKVFYHFFCNITKYDCDKLYVESIFLLGFTSGTLCAPPGAWSDKNSPGQIGLTVLLFLKSWLTQISIVSLRRMLVKSEFTSKLLKDNVGSPHKYI